MGSYIHIYIIFFFILKRKEILPHVTTWMNPVDIMLSEKHWSQKEKYLWYHLHEVLTAVKFPKIENRMVVSGAEEEEMERFCLIGIEFQLCKIKRVPWMDGGNGSTTM